MTVLSDKSSRKARQCFGLRRVGEAFYLSEKGSKRVAGQTEMLLPISGKKAKETAKQPAKTGARQKKAG